VKIGMCSARSEHGDTSIGIQACRTSKSMGRCDVPYSVVSVLLYLHQSISPNHRYINVAVSYNRKPSNYIAATHTLSVVNVHRQIC
jgi:hypothetical protein